MLRKLVPFRIELEVLLENLFISAQLAAPHVHAVGNLAAKMSLATLELCP